MKTLTQILGTLLLALVVALMVALSFGVGVRHGRKTAKQPVELIVVWDTTVVYDTIVRDKPVPVKTYVYDTVVTHFTTIEHDTVAVEVPMERRVYEEDSLYHAVVSGWRPSLDTLVIWPKTTTVTITRTERIPVPRWSIGATVGPSLIATPKGSLRAGFGVTAGLSYRF